MILSGASSDMNSAATTFTRIPGDEVHIGALLVVAVVLRSGLGAGIERQTGVADVGLLADVQIAHGRLDVDSASRRRRSLSLQR